MKKWDYYEDENRKKEGQDTTQFVRNRPQDSVSEQKISLRLNMGRGHQGVGGDEVVWVSKNIRGEKGKRGQCQEQDYKA